MYLCIPKKQELMDGVIFHSYNNYGTPININDYNFFITGHNNQVFLFYIINIEVQLPPDNLNLIFFIFKGKKFILDDFHKITINNDEFNMINYKSPWFCNTNELNNTNQIIIMFLNNILRVYLGQHRLFDCPIKNYYPDGLCTEYSNSIKFIRQYKNGVATGEGTEYFLGSDKIKYKGFFLNYQYHGECECYYPSGNLQYKGKFTNGIVFKGTEYYDYNGGIKYEGEMIDYKYNGHGIQYYNGVFCNGNIKGKKKFEGFFANGLYHGEGIKYNNVNGNIQFKGFFSNGKLNGQALEYNEAEELIYDGKYSNDTKHGAGSEYTNGKISFKGEFSNGVYHGTGSRYALGGFPLGSFTYTNGKIQ
jgi:antitoxin component YwqK of YwqJK toxin-antitoxin module